MRLMLGIFVTAVAEPSVLLWLCQEVEQRSGELSDVIENVSFHTHFFSHSHQKDSKMSRCPVEDCEDVISGTILLLRHFRQYDGSVKKRRESGNGGKCVLSVWLL